MIWFAQNVGFHKRLCQDTAAWNAAGNLSWKFKPMKLIGWIWRLLPDKCEMPGCCRQGVRGNENIVAGKVMCDYCHSAYLDKIREKIAAKQTKT